MKQIDPSVYIHPSAVVIGDVTIGADSSVWPQAVVRGDVNKITIGAETNIQDGCVLHVTHDGPYTPGGLELVIGNQVTIGHRAVLHACTVGDRCLIGIGAIVLDGAVLETETLLAAGTLVSPNKRLESGYLWKGVPAKRTRSLTDSEREFLTYSAQHYVRLQKRCNRSD